VAPITAGSRAGGGLDPQLSALLDRGLDLRSRTVAGMTVPRDRPTTAVELTDPRSCSVSRPRCRSWCRSRRKPPGAQRALLADGAGFVAFEDPSDQVIGSFDETRAAARATVFAFPFVNHPVGSCPFFMEE
jgi:hypothetical protein